MMNCVKMHVIVYINVFIWL